jgi:hypothetical protein
VPDIGSTGRSIGRRALQNGKNSREVFDMLVQPPFAKGS